MGDARRLILASTSPYRRTLLARLQLDFECVAPDCDESPQRGEAPPALASRLALAKVQAVAPAFPDALVIGSDQVAELDGDAIGKPGSHPAAREQLRRCSGRIVVFHTAVCVLDTASGARHPFLDCTQVHFRTLHDDEIERYLQLEQPYDCAGSFKCEGLGVALFATIESSDPTALIGLPLIALCDRLRVCGLRLP